MKIWEVKFGNNWTSKTVKANNYKQAVEIAQKLRRNNGDTYRNRVQDIDSVEMVLEVDE